MSLAERLKSLAPTRFSDAVADHITIALERSGWWSPKDAEEAITLAEKLQERVGGLEATVRSLGSELSDWMERATQRSATISELTKAGADAEAQMQAMDAQLSAAVQGRAEAITLADEHFRGLTQAKSRIKELEAGIEALYVERNDVKVRPDTLVAEFNSVCAARDEQRKKFEALAVAVMRYASTAPILVGDNQVDELREQMLLALKGGVPDTVMPFVGTTVRLRAGSSVVLMHVASRDFPYLGLTLHLGEDAEPEMTVLFTDVAAVTY